MQGLGELATDDETGAQRRSRIDDRANGGIEIIVPEWRKVAPLEVALAPRAEADDLVGRKVPEFFGVFEVFELADLDVVHELDDAADGGRIDATDDDAGE